MKTYEFTHPTTGQTIEVDSPDDSLPSEAELDHMFAQTGQKTETGLGEKLLQRGKNIGQEISKYSTKDYIKSAAYPFAPSRPALNIAGEVAGGINDIIGSGLTAAYEGLIPQGLRDVISSGTKEAANQLSSPAAMLNPATMIPAMGVRGLGLYGKGKEWLNQNEPELGQNVQAIENIATLLPIGKGGQLATKEAGKIVKDVTSAMTTPLTETALNREIALNIPKAIKPSISGKGTIGALQNWTEKAVEGVKTIVKNKDVLQFVDDAGELITETVPKSLKQMTDAIVQVKEKIFNQFDALAKSAGEAGALVDEVPLASQLKKLAADPVMQTYGAGVTEYASKLADEIIARGGKLSPLQAQQAIKTINARLSSASNNITFDTASKAYLDSTIVDYLREATDKAVSSIKGKGYSQLKKDYGSVKSLEPDTLRRYILDQNKKAKGFLDIADAFSTAEMIRGIMLMSPTHAASGVGINIFKNWAKHMNNPNRYVEKMFKVADKSLSGFQPSSATGKALTDIFGIREAHNVPSKSTGRSVGGGE